jgi:hypothetical protein
MPKRAADPEAVRMGRVLIALVFVAIIVATLGGRGFHSGG